MKRSRASNLLACWEIMTLMFQDLLLAFTKVYGSLKGEIFEKCTFNSIARARRVPTPLWF
ncbi:MAG: hypothetical protein QOK88_10215 [Nitrososphaeraceae archaeon]|nr:hypothetical protein [Nitrososphaeraceae archaeon]